MSYLIFLISLFLIIIVSLDTNAQVFPVDSIVYNGDRNKNINIIIMGDGYLNSQLANFVNDSKNACDYFFTVTPFKEYKNYFNVYTIKVPSAESGTDHPRTAPDCPPETVHPLLFVNTYFNSTFDSYSIHRLLVPSDYTAVNNVIINNFPLYDLKSMLVNTLFYGGSGGSTATASLNQSSNEIILHEIGHSFANLADEYWAGDTYASEKPNMTRETDPKLVKWKNWMGVDGVGIYQHGTTGIPAIWYRPHNNCKMRTLGPAFCPVCKEAITLTILKKFGNPIKSYIPGNSVINISSDSVKLKVNLYKPNPNTLRTKWLLNGVKIRINSDSIIIRSNQLNSGNNSLYFEVLDTTSFIRAESHSTMNTYSVSWTINKTNTVTEPEKRFESLKIYPNPVSNELIIEMEGNSEKQYFEISNTLGQVIFKGYFIEKTIVPTSNFNQGLYLILVKNSKTWEVRKFNKQF